MELKDKNILVIGMARSGISAAKLCMKKQGNVTLYDGKNKEQLEDSIQLFGEEKPMFAFGPFNHRLLEETELIIMSPGVPLNLPFIKKAEDMRIPIWSEIELAYHMCKAPIIAITGTNGKTTTTTLVGEIMKAYSEDTFVVGNIGIPFTEVVDQMEEGSQVVAEISSFQLETIQEFSPTVSAILNVTPDHLNRHKTMENYVNAKLRITENQSHRDYCVLNFDNDICRSLADKIPSQVIFFSKKPMKEKSVYIRENWVCTNLFSEEKRLIHTDDFGEHHVENIMAAIAITICHDIPLDIILGAIKAFKGVAHRLEYVETIDSVRYFNDSKATNEDAAINGIKSMKATTVLIAGGMDKGSSFDKWITSFDGKVRALVVFGETASIIEETAKKYGFKHVYQVWNLQEAVLKASQLAVCGDNVLLSPACASWDMFRDYEQRGDMFKDYVHALT